MLTKLSWLVFLKYKYWLDLLCVCVCMCVCVCVCVCVFEIHVLKIFIERWFWELNMFIGSLVKLHVGLHSCLCFSHLKKLVLKAGLTPPRYLAVCRASSAFSYRNPNNFSILGGSIKNGSASSIASRHLVDQSSFCSWFWWVVPRYLLDTSAVDDHFSTPSSTGVLIPFDTCIYWDLLMALLKLPVRFRTHFIRYLSRYFFVFSPKISHLTPIFVPQGFFKLFQDFLHLVSF